MSSSILQIPPLNPYDIYNRILEEQTHPPDWVNPTVSGTYDLVVIGGGTAGLTAAGACAAVGGRVALIERHLTGGDCLVTGCVPSKALIASARMVASLQGAQEYGVNVPDGISVDFTAVMERMRRVRAQMSPVDSVQHLHDSGVDVFLGVGKFVTHNIVEACGQRLPFTRAVIATGGRAVVPPIPGLAEAGYLTNETLFSLTERPARLVIIGAGPIGCEMAQTFQRLGSQVTVVDTASQILPREDADAASMVQTAFRHDGVELVLNANVIRVESTGGTKTVVADVDGTAHPLACDAILIGVGRAPNVEGLGLESAGIHYNRRGVRVNDFLQTSNARVYAAGDIASPLKFTHTANRFGHVAMRNAFFGFPWIPFSRGRWSRVVVPWCTYTDPEIAHVGLYEQQAREQGYRVTTQTAYFSDNDRAILDGDDQGFVRVHLKRGTDRILGATIVASHAGELLTYFTMAMSCGYGLSKLATPVYPYPTQAEILKKVVGMHMQSKLTPTVARLLRMIIGWRR